MLSPRFARKRKGWGSLEVLVIEPLRGKHARPLVFVRLSGENLIGRICGTNIFVVLRGAVETNRFLLNFGTIGPWAVGGNLFCTIRLPCSLLLEILVCPKSFTFFASFCMKF